MIKIYLSFDIGIKDFKTMYATMDATITASAICAPMDVEKTINFMSKQENSFDYPFERANEGFNMAEGLGGWGKMKGKNNSCTKHTGYSSTY